MSDVVNAPGCTETAEPTQAPAGDAGKPGALLWRSRSGRVMGAPLLRTAPPPLASGAHDADQPGTCALCAGRWGVGDRIAELTVGGLAHVHCVARAVTDG